MKVSQRGTEPWTIDRELECPGDLELGHPGASSDEFVVGVDLGGTKTIVAAASLNERILGKLKVMTPKQDGPLQAAWLLGLIGDFLNRNGLPIEGLKALAVGVPGAVDGEAGDVFLAPNLGWTQRYPLRRLLCDALRVPVLIDNDVNMAAIGEKSYGVAKGVKDFVFVAVGTGIGAGIVIDGRVYRGAHWSAGEIGYQVLSRDCLSHTYNDHGYLELVASGQGICQQISELLEATGAAVGERTYLDTEQVFRAAAAGDPVANKVVGEALDSLGMGLANIIALLDPELIVLGGGVLNDECTLEPIRNTVRRLIPTKTRITMSALGTVAQALGALATAFILAGHGEEGKPLGSRDARYQVRRRGFTA